MTHKVAIIGAAGYTGQELMRLLQFHKDFELRGISSDAHEGKPLAEAYPFLARSYPELRFLRHDQVVHEEVDLFFLATPNDVSLRLVPELRGKGRKVVDLAGSFRLSDADVFSRFYNLPHPGREWIAKRVYGLPELNRSAIAATDLVANPGCYPTGVLLALLPLRSYFDHLGAPIMVDAKSGVSGAGGRSTTPGLGFVDVNESFKAYKVLRHQHEPEIREHLLAQSKAQPALHFVPHLVPMNRGILSTIWLHFPGGAPIASMREDLEKAYAGEPFVAVLSEGQLVQTSPLSYTNQCHIQIHADPSETVVVLTAAIDNLGKGAAGQALQNGNIMMGLPETMGLA